MLRGSSWNTWDLHLHTPFSVLNNQFGDPAKDKTWERYITEVESKAREKHIVALGITDYFTIEGYKRVLEFQKAGRLSGILLLPNIEFRVDKVIYRSKGASDPKRLTLHVLFSPEIAPVKIEEGFLHDLDFVHENDPFEPTKTRKLKILNLVEFGETLQVQHPNFSGHAPFHIGCQNAVVRAEEIKEFLDNRFRGKYLLILADENLELMNWDSQDHGVRKQLVQMSHAFFSSNPRTRDFGLGKTHSSAQVFIDEFKSLKPCVWGCDSHGYDERFLEPDEKRYCWIKGEVTWEGLKQILYEPSERVRIQEVSPEPDKSVYTISSFEIAQTKINDALGVDSFQLQLNSNLITIIGGRGSGKTALLDILAACFREGNKLSLLETSFYYRLYGGDNTRKRPASQPIAVNLTFKSGETFAKSIGSDEVYFEKADVIYLTQNHFDEYSANPDKLYDHIINLVFEKYVDDRRKYEEMEGDIASLGQAVQTVNLEIEQLRAEVEGQKALENENRKMKEGEQEDYTKRISDIEEKQGGSDALILDLTKKLEGLKATRRNIESLLSKLSELQHDVDTFKGQYDQNVTSLNQDLSALSLSTITFPVEVNDLNKILELIVHNTATLALAQTETENVVSSTQKEFDELEGISRVIAELRQRVNDIAAEIDVIQQRINEVIAKEQRIADLDQKRFDIYARIMIKTINLRLFLQGMIGKFEAGMDELLQRLKFSALIDMRKKSEYIETLVEKVDNRVHSETYLWNQFSPIFDKMSGLLNSFDVDVDFSQVTSAIKILAQNLKLKRSTTESDFYNAVLRKFFGIGLKIEFNSKALNELSMGERAIVLLKILLSLDDKPLFIDQPEEHLDNRYIYNELIPAFRSAKAKRQIIIATHNANLVVNADAEQVVIAEHVNGMLSYQAGTLEDLNIRESIKTILEGGDEAFKKREEKYGYRF